MRMRFPSSLWIQILCLAIKHIGGAHYEDEFQRSNFYTNEQGVGVEVERSNADKGTAKKQYDGRVVEEKIEKDGRSEANLQLDYAVNNEGDYLAEIKSPRHNRKNINKRFTQRERASRLNSVQNGIENHFQIPRERVQFIDGLDYQDRMDNDKHFVVLSREETRGLRQARKSFSDPANTNWKWGFKRKQVKPDHGVKDAAIYGVNHNSYKHKEAAYARNQQSDAMARAGPSNGEIIDNDNYSAARPNMMLTNAKLADQKNMRGEMHQQAYQRQEFPEENYHRGVALQRPPDAVARPIPDAVARPDTLGRSVANTMPIAQGSPQEMAYPKINNVHQPDCARRAYNWDTGNPRIYSAPKLDSQKTIAAASPHVDTLRVDNTRAENSLRVDIPQMDSQMALNPQMEPNKMEHGKPIDEQRMENVPRMGVQKNDEIPRIEHQRTNEVGPRMEEQGVESVPLSEPRYENSNVMGYPSPCCQRHEDARNEAIHGSVSQRVEGCQRLDSGQRIDNSPSIDNGWRDDGLQRITSAQRMKQSQGGNIINNMAASSNNGIQRLDNPPAAGGGMREEEIRYLVFTPAEFSPMTLRTVLGESEKPLSHGIPYCTLEEYKMESASLQGKSDNFQDRQMQYRGKGYINDVITRRKRKNRKAWKKFPVRQPRIASQGKKNCVQMPVHDCTASTCKTKCPYGLVVQTEPFDPYDCLTTQCYVDALTMSTCSHDIGINPRITPSKIFDGLRGHRPIISHFDNTVYTTHVPPPMLPPCPKSKECGLHRARPTPPVIPLLKPKRMADVVLLSDIINDIVKSNTTLPSVSHAKRESPEEIKEEEIIEKYLTSLMEQQNNRSKAQHYERNSYQGGVWLGKLLAELAENKLRSKMRMLMNQPTNDKETPLRTSKK